MNNLKVGDKVRIRSDLKGERYYGEVYFNASMKEFCGKEYIIKSITNNMYINLIGITRRNRSSEMLEPVDIKPVVKRPKYEWYAVDQDGNKFEKNAIGDRYLEEIKKQIQERKDSIARDESLLRKHRSLFSKK